MGNHVLLKLIGRFIHEALYGLELLQYDGFSSDQSLLKTIISQETEHHQGDKKTLDPNIISYKPFFAPIMAYYKIYDPGHIVEQKW